MSDTISAAHDPAPEAEWSDADDAAATEGWAADHDADEATLLCYRAEGERHERLSNHVNLLMSWRLSGENDPPYNLDPPWMDAVRKEYVLNLTSALRQMTAIQERSRLLADP